MQVSELLERLSYGELSNLAISNNGNGTIIEAQQPKIISYTNEGLLRLYSRYVLEESDVLVQLYDSITLYNLLPAFAVHYVPGSEEFSEPIRYLLDTADAPFKDEVIRITTLFDNYGQHIPLNDEERHDSCFSPQVKVLQVPDPISDKVITVRYQKRHSKLNGELTQIITCPDVLLGALTSYIAYKVYSHMNSVESNAKAQEFNANFEQICNEVMDRDLVSSSVSQTNTRFARGGWR